MVSAGRAGPTLAARAGAGTRPPDRRPDLLVRRRDPGVARPDGGQQTGWGDTRPSTIDVPETRSDALWNFARDVDAAFVKTMDWTRQTDRAEYERFLFYRGLGQSRMPMRADARSGGTLALERETSLGDGVRHIFVLKVENGRGAYQYRPALRPGEQATGVIPSMEGAKPLAEFTEAIADALAAKLTESGLYPKEARAMVNTWKNSYFQNDGIRVLFVLPQSWTDAFIPMNIAAEAQGGRPGDGRPAGVAEPRARAIGRVRGPRPGRPGPGPAT